MSDIIFLLSTDSILAGEIARLVGPCGQLVVGGNPAQLRAAAEQGKVRAVLVHVGNDLAQGSAPGPFFSALQEAADSAPIVALVEPDCPARWRTVVETVLDEALSLPLAPAQLARLLPTAGEVDDAQTDLPYRAVQGPARSLVTFTPEMFGTLEELQVAIAHNVTVLLVGETGTGKTYLARLIHELSARADKRFCTVACGALPADLVESELFGYTKGAFTGADRDREGKFTATGDGTLLLDEIDVLSLDQQAKLLRVIETGEYEPVGSNDTRISRARLIAASNVELEQLAESGRFRSDLYYRLNILRINLHPLRKRPLDIEYLARRFARQYGQAHGIKLEQIQPEFFDALRGYHWPGNVRELENVIRRAVLYCREGVLTVADLPSALRSLPPVAAPRVAVSQHGDGPHTLDVQLGVCERRIIEEALARNELHRGATARELGISRVTLYHKMKKFGLLGERAGEVEEVDQTA
ncbi:MAG: sigma-54 interaction domain-containing protein [Pirellulales bacterium]